MRLGNHTFAVVKGSESYSLLSSGLRDVFKEVNTLISRSELTVMGQKLKLKFVLGSDYEVW